MLSNAGPKGVGGFTLLEVLVALVIVTLVMAAAIGAAGSKVSNTTYIKEKTFAQWIAMNKVTELRIDHAWPSVGRQNGVVTMAQQKWQWTVETKATPDSDVRRLEVSVRREDAKDKDQQIAKLTAFIGRPL
jgi:general secretion pathway protein I